MVGKETPPRPFLLYSGQVILLQNIIHLLLKIVSVFFFFRHVHSFYSLFAEEKSIRGAKDGFLLLRYHLTNTKMEIWNEENEKKAQTKTMKAVQKSDWEKVLFSPHFLDFLFVKTKSFSLFVSEKLSIFFFSLSHFYLTLQFVFSWDL